MTGILNLLAGSISSAIKDGYFNLVTLLLPGNGTNGAQNNTFLDSSTNNFTITRNGNTTQGTFSPFSQTGWSNFFDGTDDYLTITDNAVFQFGTGNFTIEFWVNFSTVNSADRRIWSYQAAGSATVVNVTIDTSNKISATLRSSTGTGTNTIAGTTTMVVGTWYHVAFVRSGTTTYLFVNGTQEATASSQNQDLGSGLIGIGARSDATEDFAGYISNLRVTKGGALYTSNFTPSTTPLTTTVSAGTVSLLTCQSNRFIDNSSNAFAITVNGTPSVQAFSPFAPTAAYSASTNGGSGYFDGTGDYLTGPNNTALNFGTGDFCVELWIYPSDLSFRIYLSSSDGADAQIGYDPGNGPRFLYFYNNVNVFSGQTAGFRANQWNHIVLCRSGTTLSYYCNGTRAYTNTSYSSSVSFSTPYVGAYSAGGYNYLGNISGVRLVKGSSVYTPSSSTLTVPTAPPTAITNTSFLLNFTNGGIIDATAKNVLETVGNAQISTTQSKWGGASIYLDGTSDWLSTGTNQDMVLGTAPFTIECWIYFVALNGGAIAGTRNANTDQSGNRFTFNVTSSGQFFLYSGGFTYIGSTGAVATGQWYHVALVREGTGSGQTKVYVNGSSIGSATFGNNLTANYIDVGSRADNNTNAYIDDFRVSSYARYTTNFTPPTAAFALR